MKRVSAIGLLILIALALLAMCISCNPISNAAADDIVTDMESPVVIIGMYKDTSDYGTVYRGVTVRDRKGRILTLDATYTLSKTLAVRHIGDTIK
jgi:hypothetical protein